MNIIFFCQSRSLDVFYQVYQRLRRKIKVDRAGFYIANLFHYEKFLKRHPNFENDGFILKEWEIYAAAEGHLPDIERIKAYERQIGDPTLWTPIVTDRRLYLGAKSTYRQDYAPRFQHKQQLAVLDVALTTIDDFITKKIRPDLILTLYTATFGDCLAHLFAEARGIRAFDLQQSRIYNYVMFAEGVKDPSPHFIELLKKSGTCVSTEHSRIAVDYIEQVKAKKPMYEGVLLLPQDKAKYAHAKHQTDKPKTGALSKTRKLVRQKRKKRKAPYAYDFQTPAIIEPLLYRQVWNKIRAGIIRRKLARQTISANLMQKGNYAFFPLHTEPELVISQFARPCLNQIEVARNISLSLPVGMELWVKEHPLMIGRRPLGYYRKLLEIPNLRFVDWQLPAEAALECVKLVVIIRGATGLEAAIRGIPVVALGQSLFQLLPQSMYRICSNLYELPQTIHDLLENYRFDYEGLVRFITAVIAGSAPVNLLELLDKRKGRFKVASKTEAMPFENHPHLDILCAHLIHRIERRI